MFTLVGGILHTQFDALRKHNYWKLKLNYTVKRWTYKVAECEYHRQPAIGQGSMFATSADVWLAPVTCNCSSCIEFSLKIDPFTLCS